MPVVVALGVYTRPSQWTFGRVFIRWQFEPTVLAIALIGLLGYAAGVARMRSRDIRWGAGRGNLFHVGHACCGYSRPARASVCTSGSCSPTERCRPWCC